MAKYFVHAGLQFETISVLPTDLDGVGTENVDACTLESVVTALGSDIVSGANPTIQMTTIRSWWSQISLSDTFLIASREILNANAPLIASAVTGQDPDSSLSRNFHKLSSEYILPTYLANAMVGIAISDGDASMERNRLVVRAISVRHDNIMKHDTEEEAWQAWTAYVVTQSARQDMMIAQQGYLINPSMAASSSTSD